MNKKELIIHCSDSPHSHHGRDEIDRWHKERGWSGIGYHWVIERSGELKEGRKESQTGAHTLGHNKEIGLCLCGLSGAFENEQMATLEKFVIANAHRLKEIKQHSDYSKEKPHCAGLNESQMTYLNSLL